MAREVDPKKQVERGKNKDKDNGDDKGAIESMVDTAVDFVKENTGLLGEGARDIEGRDKEIEDATRTKPKRDSRDSPFQDGRVRSNRNQ